MPKITTSVPKYRCHKASQRAVVTLNGRDYYLGPFKSKASRIEYDRLIGEWLQNNRYPLLGPTAEITVVELAARYLKYARSYYHRDGKCTGEVPGIQLALQFLSDWYGRHPVSEFGPLALKAVRERMVEADRGRRYVNAQIGRIKRMFKWGVAEELVPPAVHQALAAVTGLRCGRTSARESTPVLPLDDATLEITLQHLPEVVADMVRLQRLSGMRPAEVCMMRPGDVDRTARVWLYRPRRHKTEHHGRDRIVYLGQQAQEVLLRYLARGAEVHCFRPCDSEQKRLAAQHAARETPLSCGNRPGTNRKAKPKKKAGDCYTTNSYRHAIHYACVKAGIDKWSPNRLRHSAATEIRRKYGLEAAQVILGHSTADITQVYAERDSAKAMEVAWQIG